ncbi:MAG TPA: hypothetical protein VL295_06255 [Gemmatimonadales bacterium]|nr:hypothetical protein [Gemmatimonadales bacterium]
MPLSRRILRAGASLALLAAASGCYAWQYEAQPVPDVLARQPTRVLVPVTADSFVVLLGAEVANDSVVGLVEGSAEGGERLTRFAAPLTEVPQVALEHLKFFKSAKRVGDAAERVAVPVGNYFSRLMVLGGIVLGTVAFGAYVQGAGH